jgi:transposase-like protein
VAQIASENHIHPNQIHKWKKQALENFVQLFEEDRNSLYANDKNACALHWDQWV